MLMLVSYTLVAQEEETMREEALRSLNPPEMVLGGPDGEGAGVVGAIPSTVDVSALGGATYSIPIQLPEGINGMQPNLSIVYNSQSGNGLLGWGWNLGGVSAITRVGSTLYHDGCMSVANFSNHDRFALDGQRLIVLDGATYGSNGAEYKTEIDGMSKIVSYTGSGIVHGPKYFKVWTAEGLILEYGNSSKSRFSFATSGGGEVGMWLINKVTDRNGNYMVYEYDKDEESIRLSKIYYNIREDLPGCYSVVFNYESRVDEELFFIGNHAVKQKDLLSSIQVKWWEKEIYRYDFVYDMESGSYNSLYYYNRIKQILFSSEGVSYNPTVIHWGEINTIQNNYYPHCDDIYVTDLERIGTSPNDIIDKVKFVGDFNGDCLSDFIVATKLLDFSESEYMDSAKEDENYNIWQLDFYINKGFTKDGSNPGLLGYEHQGHIIVLQGIKWCFVCDIDGDGLDDVYVQVNAPGDGFNLYTSVERIYAYRSVIDENGVWDIEEVSFEDDQGNQTTNYEQQVNKFKPASFMVGDFCGRGRMDGILAPQKLYGQYPKIVYFTYEEDVLKVKEGEVAFIGTTFRTGDFDGDGITEIWYASSMEGDHKGVIRKIYQPVQGTYSCFNVKSDYLSSNHNVFTADFNGDGRADFFYYDKTNDKWKAEICGLSGEQDNPFVYDLTSILENYYADGDPGEYGYTLDGRIISEDNSRYYVDLADINGDQKTDLILRNNSKVVFFYGPLIALGNQASFSRIDRYEADDIGFAGPKSYSICSGNFFGQENAAFLSDYTIHSVPPASVYNNVIAITDGMGNNNLFDYGYLVENPMNDNNIFVLDALGKNLNADIYTKAFPLKALRQMTGSNLYSDAPETSISYNYRNVLVHKYGRGVLGFAKTSMVSKLQGVAQEYTESYMSTAISEHPCALTEIVRKFGPTGLVLMESFITYDEYKCPRSSEGKVFITFARQITTDSYDVESGNFFTRTIEKSDYITDNRDLDDFEYSFVVSQTKSYLGTSINPNILEVALCEFQSLAETNYYELDYNAWVVNRPESVLITKKRLDGSSEDVKSLETYVYEASNPFLLSKVTTYPGGDQENANGLATYMSYNYDAAGNVVDEILGALDGSLNIVHNHHEYHSNYRFPILARNQLGYESQQQFNSEYGELSWTKDCNGLKTSYWRDDHLGSTDWSKTPDNVYSCVAKRWAVQNGELVDDAREGSAYYVWSHSSDGSPTRVFYDASGRELRTVKVGINGQLIYLDTDYDEETGHVQKSYEPYYKGSTETRLYTEYHYDDYDRLYQTDYPDGSNNTTSWEVATGRVSTINEFEGADGRAQCTKNVSNIVGWTIENMDSGGNIVYYNYYSDGKLRSAGLNPDVEITLEYDDARNRTVLYDPNYGRVENHYNAYGELEYTITPKGDRTIYEFDDLRRQVGRREISEGGIAVDVTLWNYSDDAPTKGLLESINFNDGSQIIEYTYDDKSRVETILETRGTKTYKTSYHYDANTGRIDRVTYPTGFAIKKVYENGHLIDVTDDVGNILWHTENKNASGQITDYKLGNGIVGTMSYYPETHRLETQYATINGNKVQDFLYHYDVFGNLASRTERKYTTPMTESFGYDELNRLKTIALNGVVSSMWYDDYGRIGSKMAGGEMVFYEADYDNRDRPHAIRGAEINNNAFPMNVQQFDVAYTMFDKVKSIIQDRDCLDVDYGYDHQRIAFRQYLYQGDVVSKGYVGNCEYIKGPDRMRTLTYLTGPMGVFAVYEQLGDLYKDGDDKGKTCMHYLLKDHLGSITTITNAEGAIEQELSLCTPDFLCVG